MDEIVNILIKLGIIPKEDILEQSDQGSFLRAISYAIQLRGKDGVDVYDIHKGSLIFRNWYEIDGLKHSLFQRDIDEIIQYK